MVPSISVKRINVRYSSTFVAGVVGKNSEPVMLSPRFLVCSVSQRDDKACDVGECEDGIRYPEIVNPETKEETKEQHDSDMPEPPPYLMPQFAVVIHSSILR